MKPAVEDVRQAFLNSENNESSTFFSHSGSALVGLYAGSDILHSDGVATVLKGFTDYMETQDSVGRVILQYCGKNSRKGLGVVVDAGGDLAAVKQIMRGWNEAKCQTQFEGSKKFSKSKLRFKTPSKSTSGSSGRHEGHGYGNSHLQRATCRTVQVSSGDSCGSLASDCGISPADFTKFNPGEDVCSSLKPGQHVCCSAGEMPDFKPKPDADGTCASVVVQPGHTCSEIASANSVTQRDLEDFNKETWGWMGCESLQAQQRICLSKGGPPMPAVIDNAVCGPQVPGTKKPTDGTKLADLNPCPLKTCCNIWGQCGITDDFCTITKSPTGAPGTAKKGTDGCMSSCGTDIVNNEDPPDQFISIGYFEAWNDERYCLNMDITSFDTAAYTHLHFAFAEVTESYEVDLSRVQAQFDKLKKMGFVQRILSFGGWSFSTEADSAPIFRQGVTDAKRELFATNVARFIVDNDLEGVDFDWEYPGAPDIPGIPAGDPGDGERYLWFLKLVREKLPAEKSVAIAAPASFWYLKGFPIAEISEVVDYIVYMTYDLHGQWDFGNKYASPGCPDGDCLRSHVNLTETTSALSMITKAGVPSKKIVVGLSSFGRSFKMSKADCIGSNCKYEGPDSSAAPGNCTKTPGYIADAEIYQILDEDSSAKKSYDNGSDSNILVYGSTEWVAFMDADTKSSRTDYYRSLNMGGTTDWAVDLQTFSRAPSNSLENQTTVVIDQSIWTDEKPKVQCPGPCVLVLPEYPLGSTSVISRPAYVTTLDVAWPTGAIVTNTNGDVDTTTTVTRILQETTILPPPGMLPNRFLFPMTLLIRIYIVTLTALSMADINITIPLTDYDNVSFTPRPRLPPQVVNITNDPNPLKETGILHPPVTRSVTLPPWPQDTVIYVPPRGSDDEDQHEDDNKDDEDGKDDDNNLPVVPVVNISDGPGGPKCTTNCPGPCSDPFCICIFCPGSDGGDGGFADPNDPSPRPKPAIPSNPRKEKTPSSCSEPSSTTNYWVSCKTEDSRPTSTSCTTTSSMVVVGCEVTATTTTTGVDACPSVDPNDDQGQDGTGAPLSVSATTTTTSESTPTPAIETFAPPDLPSRNNLQFVIFALYFEEDAKHTWNWVGMVVPIYYNGKDVCGEYYRVLLSYDFSQDDSYPDYLGSFSAPGLTACNYTSVGSDPGDVDCKEASLSCVGFDSLHTDVARSASFECTGSGGRRAAYWLQNWCA